MDRRPLEYRCVWEKKPVLARLYQSYYRMILARCREGETLEIGGGSGNLKSFAPHVVSSDLLFAPWLDAVADAQRLPFAEASFDNIVLFDVLHHIPQPVLFLAEAARVLRPGGRVVMMEPAITPVSHLFYHLFHPEPVRMREDPMAEPSDDVKRDPFDANQAIPTLLFGRHRRKLAEAVPGLRVGELRRLALFTYPMTGGFKPWSLLPARALPLCLAIERALEPVLASFMAFRMLVVLERGADLSAGRPHGTPDSRYAAGRISAASAG